MFDWSWIGTSWSALLMVFLTAVFAYAALILYTRVAGLRSFSKLSSFDFAITVSIGSIIAATILAPEPPLLQALFALGSIYALQMLLAVLRVHWDPLGKAVDNAPLLIMDGPRMLHDNMKKAQITEGDLWAKLREANVLDLAQVRAVVVESTGDVSVLHGPADGESLDAKLLTGVRRHSAFSDRTA